MSTGSRSVRWCMLGLALVLAVAAAFASASRPATTSGPDSPGGARAPATHPAAAGGQQAGTAAPAAPAVDPFTAAKAMPLEELHQRALAEGGTFHFYATLAPAAAEKVFPAFEARFPGIKVDQVDATGDRLMARIVSESRGGKTLADAFSGTLNFVQPLNQQGFFAQVLPDEALELPEDLRGPYWFTTNQQFVVAAYNTERVRPDEIPRQYEDFGDARWKDRLMLDPSDVELLMGLARKYGSDDQAADVLRRIAANNPAVHRGHSELAELLAAGQGDVCLTCFADHILARVRRGAPVD